LIKWTQPNTKLAAQNLIDLGATAIVFMPIGFATENHETILDVHHIVHALKRKNPHVTFAEMPCVNDNPEFLKMAAEWANPQIEALLGETALAVNPQLAATQASHHHHHHH
jgi:ferrochelatase